MNRDIAALTARQLLGKKRTAVPVLFALLPVLLATVYRFGDTGHDAVEFTARGLLGGFVIATLLPLAALVFGTAALGAEIEDGTAVYLLAKPLPRAAILLPKLAVAALATAAFVLVSALLAVTVSAGGEPEYGQLLAGFAIALVVGSVAYCAVFMLLSVVTSRAFIAGLVYVFLWEGLITSLFSGTRIFSIRQYTLGIAGEFAGLSTKVFDPDLGGLEAALLAAAVIAAATVLAVIRLERFEIGERG